MYSRESSKNYKLKKGMHITIYTVLAAAPLAMAANDEEKTSA